MSSITSKYSWHRDDLFKPSVVTLIAANLIPLFGVLFLGWSTFAIVGVYWSENVIIGAINVLKMIACTPSADTIKLVATNPDQLRSSSKQVQKPLEQQSPRIAVAHHVSKLFFIPFFIVHYGMFCFIHGLFIFELLGGNAHFRGGPLDSGVYFWQRLKEDNLLWAVGALAVSHLFSFFTNFLYRGEYRRVTVPQLMFQPYARIVILHLAVLFGAFLIMALGSPVWMLVMLIIGKTILDIGLHLAERTKNSNVATSIITTQAPS